MLAADLLLLALLLFWAALAELRAGATGALFGLAFWGSVASLYAAFGAAVAALL